MVVTVSYGVQRKVMLPSSTEQLLVAGVGAASFVLIEDT